MINYLEIAQTSAASQDPFELWQLLVILSQRPPRVVVEIGVHKGFSMMAWNKAFHPEVLLGIDDEPVLDHSVNAQLCNAIICENSHDLSSLDNLKTRLGGELIDFLFIDGDHTYQGAKLDYDMYSPLVGEGGVIAIHDIMRMPGMYPGVETRKVFDEVRRAKPSIELWGLCPGGTDQPLHSDPPGTGIIFK